MSDKQTWIDVSDLFEWNGHFTGIQRVAYNYAERFAQDGAHFFVHSKLDNKFIEIPFSKLVEVHKKRATKQQQTARQKMKARYKKLPRIVRVLSSPILNFTYHRARKLAALVLNSSDGLSRLPTVTFTKQDTIILLDAAWNRKDIFSGLAQAKKEHKFKLVVHLNDILPVYQGHLFTEELSDRFSEYTSKALRVADLITVISEATKQDILRFCADHKLKAPAVKVVRLGEDLNIATPQKPIKKLADNFILCVGTFEIRKNYILLYQAVKLAQQEGRELPQIVIAGRKGWLANDLEYVIKHDPAVKGKIVLLQNMSDANISWLYENCMFTAFCSVAEGWGLPVAESLQHGKLCLSSNTSSMPEIAGDLIDYFSPYDPKNCLEKIDYYVARKRYSTKNAEIKKDYRVFTWDDSYQQYKQLASSRTA